MTPTQQSPTVVVALVTYRRIDELRHTLPLVLDQVGAAPFPARVLVVDNDPDGSAEAVIRGLRATIPSATCANRTRASPPPATGRSTPRPRTTC